MQASAGAFPALVALDLSNMLLTGPLPDSWGAAPAFPALRFLGLHGNTLGDAAAPRPLPASWTQPASLSSLQASTLALVTCLQYRPAWQLMPLVPTLCAHPHMPCCPSVCCCAASDRTQSRVLFPGNHTVCTPGQPHNYTLLVGAAGSGGSGGGGGYRVLDVFFTDVTTAYMACYS